MSGDMASNPDFCRAKRLIEEAILQMEVEGGSIHSFSASMLTLSAELYRAVHGSEGPCGLPLALAKLASANAAREVCEAEGRRFGPVGHA